MKELQTALELQYSNKNLNHLFADYKDVLTSEPMAFINAFRAAEFDVEKRPDLLDVHLELARTADKLEDLVFSMLTFVLTKKEVTLQALVGTIFNAFKCATYRRRAVLIEVLLLGLTKCPYIRTERKGDYMYFHSKLSLNEQITKAISEQGFVLPMLQAPIIRNNKSIGYQTFNEHIISGGKVKEHDKEVCLDHINRLNQTFYKWESRLELMTQPYFNPEPKVKDNGQYETTEDIQDRLTSFKQLHNELPNKVGVMIKHGNRFNLIHKLDNRIRTYVKSYHFNYMGTKYLKAGVQLDDMELTQGDF